ncbi:MAG: xanthine dehydrogenase family protein subunit M [Hyphomicrobiales bacterium]|nr:xanthine dehydrogenase family protein subunit M [Hyphomicrobiales bacterium]MDE2018108.1 xanthine dehydrogenase family protein subunit M [Hyphomicrobiales bacterium]
MYPFAYHRPDSVKAAVAALGADGKFLAGGMTLIPTMKQRLAAPSALVDVSRLPGLDKIERVGDALEIGAAATHAHVAKSKVAHDAIPALARLAAHIGDPAVRSRGTIGGSVANDDPAADYPAAVLALGATIVTDRREIKAEDYFKGLFETALAAGEMIVKIRFPVPSAAHYEKFVNQASRYAIVGLFAAKTAHGLRVAVTGAGDAGVFRAKEIEAAGLAGIDKVTVPATGLNSDIHADAAYRAHLIKVLAKRALSHLG